MDSLCQQERLFWWGPLLWWMEVLKDAPAPNRSPGSALPMCVGIDGAVVPVLPLGTVVLATEDCHLLVVEEGHAAQRSPASVVHVAADVSCWGQRRGEGGKSQPGMGPQSPPSSFDSSLIGMHSLVCFRNRSSGYNGPL